MNRSNKRNRFIWTNIRSTYKNRRGKTRFRLLWYSSSRNKSNSRTIY